MLKRLSAIAATLALGAAVMAAGIDTAEAGHHRHRGGYIGGAALGLFALGAIGSRSRYERDGCYRGPARCRWVRGECYRNEDGDRDCESGHRECYRPLYCN